MGEAVTIRRRFFVQLEPTAWRKAGLSPANRLVTFLIVASVALAVAESEATLIDGHESIFLLAEICFSVIFAAEYILRTWTSAENPKYGHGSKGRLRYVCSPAAMLDLVALTPALFLTLGSEAFILRLFRFLRILRLARLGRFSSAMGAIGEAIHSRRYELMMSLVIAGLLLLISSTLLYIAEGPYQPEKFGSIPRAMWWSIATLTTVGYGDATPITFLGRLMAGLTAITGIGLIAMPTGILAAAFSNALEKQRRKSPKEEE